MCANCIRTRTDITEGIPKSVPLQNCRNCGRYLNPPKAWTTCQPESKELMQICLKRIKGLNKVKLIDASFIWTEPHSKRLKLKLTIQKEVYSGVILQQVFVVEMVIHNFQCNNCHMVAAQNTWRAAVQVRQKVDHKRTFYLLEQLILKYKAHQQTVSVKEVPDGVDFYFLCRHHAMKFQEFVVGVVPCRKKVASEQLISEDFNNNKINAKWTFSAEIVPVCKDDVICIHPRQYSQQVIFICVGVPSLPLLLASLFLHVRPAMHALACTLTRARTCWYGVLIHMNWSAWLRMSLRVWECYCVYAAGRLTARTESIHARTHTSTRTFMHPVR